MREVPQCQCGDIEPPSLEEEAVPESGYGMGVMWSLECLTIVEQVLQSRSTASRLFGALS